MIRLRLIKPGAPPVPDERFPRWLFLGQSPAFEEACTAAMPVERRLDVARSLHELAETLRIEFAREVARVGAEQKDIRGWCSSAFAWKTPVASDLFLLTCYRLLIRRLADQAEPILIFLEDPWLYEDCRRDDGLRPFLIESMPAGLGITKIRLTLRGIASRALWAGRAALSLARQRFLFRSSGVVSGKPLYAVYSIPSARCFGSDAGWDDPYMPGLEDIISGAGGKVLRFVSPEYHGFERELAHRSGFVRPLILEAGFRDIAAAATAVWRARGLSSYALDGVSMPLLAQREWWADAGGARWCGYRLFDACFRRFLDREKPVAVIYPYENQPWEKLLCAASSGTGTVTIGYQHALVPRFFLGYWPGDEGAGAPLPDHILASGPLQKEILIKAGTPPGKIRVGGALRFRYLASSSVKPGPRRRGDRRLLVVSTPSMDMTTRLLAAVRSAFPKGGSQDGLAIFFRPHPAAQPGSPRDIAGMTTIKGDLSSQLPGFDLVVSTGSTVALEARFLGVPVILFRPSVVLDAQDPGNLVPKDFFEYATASEMREKVLRRLRESGDTRCDAAGLRDAIFSPVDEQAWLGCLAVHAFDGRKRSNGTIDAEGRRP